MPKDGDDAVSYHRGGRKLNRWVFYISSKDLLHIRNILVLHRVSSCQGECGVDPCFSLPLVPLEWISKG